MYSSHENLKGKFLIATPSLRDPNFCEGVIFICEHTEKGAFGLLINKKSHLKAETHFGYPEKGEWIKHLDLYIGGPVHTNQILILCKTDKKLPNEKKIIDNIVLVNNLINFTESDLNNENEKYLRLYYGCSGWSEHQLETEIAAGAWRVLPYNLEMIFSARPKKVWQQNLARLGGEYLILSEMPDLNDIHKN